MKVKPKNIAKRALFSMKGAKYQGITGDICVLTVACKFYSILSETEKWTPLPS
jgi:hypothetical protein